MTDAHIPRPGQAVRGSDTGRPIMAALDLLGRRWSLGIIWALRDGPQGFRAMQATLGRLSPDTLSRRLRDLKAAHIVMQDDKQAWMLSEKGALLLPILLDLYHWAEDWAALQAADQS